MKLLYILSIGICILSCNTQKQVVSGDPSGLNLIAGGKLFTALYQQQAAEYKALCFQAYNVARLRLDEELKTPSAMPLAIVTDIDETMLDNSPYAVHQALLGKDYDIESWKEWTALGECDTLAGALSFFKYAASKGVEIFYVTNREESEREGTLKNLNRFGFPLSDKDHLILRETSSSKESRRQRIASTHNIVIFLGDNLPDFSAFYDKKNVADRLSVTQKFANEFGDHFIILPNPVYGDWESALYEYNYQKTQADREGMIRRILRNYGK